MSREQIMWSVGIGFIFFILGWISSRKTKFMVKKLFRTKDIYKARNLYKKGKKEKSLEAYETIRKDLDEDDWFDEIDFLNIATCYLVNRNIVECIKYCQKIMNFKGIIPIDLRMKVAALCLNNQYFTFSKNILLHGEPGNNAMWHSTFAWALSANQDYNQALHEAEIALQIGAAEANSSINRCGLAFLNVGSTDKAHKCFKDSLLSKNPEIKMWAYNNIGSICTRKGNKCAISHNLKNKARYEKVSLSFYKKAYSILKENRLWETAIDPSTVLVNLISHTKNIDEKTDYIEFALEIAPYSPLLYARIASMYYDHEDYQNSLKNAEKAYTLNPTDTEILEILTASYLKNFKYNETISTAFEAWHVKSDLAHGNLEGFVAEAHEQLGNISESLKYYKIAIAKGFRKKENYFYFYEKAINLSYRIRDFNSAMSLCFDALTYFPENKGLQDYLGKIIIESGKKELYKFNPFPE